MYERLRVLVNPDVMEAGRDLLSLFLAPGRAVLTLVQEAGATSINAPAPLEEDTMPPGNESARASCASGLNAPSAEEPARR